MKIGWFITIIVFMASAVIANDQRIETKVDKNKDQAVEKLDSIKDDVSSMKADLKVLIAKINGEIGTRRTLPEVR